MYRNGEKYVHSDEEKAVYHVIKLCTVTQRTMYTAT